MDEFSSELSSKKLGFALHDLDLETHNSVERMRLLNSLDPKWNIYIISFPKTQRSSQKRVANKGRKDRKSQRKQRSAVGKGFLIMTRTLDT